MAFENNQIRETLRAAADLSGKQYHLLRLSAAEYTNQASNPGGTDNFGVLLNKPLTNEAATVVLMGMGRVVAGAALAVGAMFTTNGSGRAVTVTSGGYVFGRALEAAGADGDIVTAWLERPWKFAG